MQRAKLLPQESAAHCLHEQLALIMQCCSSALPHQASAGSQHVPLSSNLSFFKPWRQLPQDCRAHGCTWYATCRHCC